MVQNKIHEAIRFTLQCLISIYIALEIAIPPNLYTKQLVFCLIIYIIIHNIINIYHHLNKHFQ